MPPNFASDISPSHTDPRQTEKINLNFQSSRFFVVPQKVLKPFEVPQRNMKIKIQIQLSEMHGAGRFTMKINFALNIIINILFPIHPFSTS